MVKVFFFSVYICAISLDVEPIIREVEAAWILPKALPVLREACVGLLHCNLKQEPRRDVRTFFAVPFALFLKCQYDLHLFSLIYARPKKFLCETTTLQCCCAIFPCALHDQWAPENGKHEAIRMPLIAWAPA